jgi:putative SOS response-associated peptidase YedK
MCGRFVLISDLSVITEDFNIQEISASFMSSRNVSPGQHIPAVIRHDDKNILATFLWGLIPSWSKGPSIGAKLINARAETVNEKPSFKNALQRRRCLIIADGFYEWKKDGKKKIPYYFYLKSGKPFGFAGLYETWLTPEKKMVDTCIIITTRANELVQPIHERMPVIVPKDQEEIWLKNNMADTPSLLEVLKPYPAEEMEYKMANFIVSAISQQAKTDPTRLFASVKLEVVHSELEFT